MKISSFFNTHIQNIPYNELYRTSFYLPTLQVDAQLNQLAQGYPTRILGEGVVYKKNQLNHELNITVRGQPGDTFEKIFGKSRTTDMLLNSRTFLLFWARRWDQESDGLPQSYLIDRGVHQGKWTRSHDKSQDDDSITSTLRMRVLPLTTKQRSCQEY